MGYRSRMSDETPVKPEARDEARIMAWLQRMAVVAIAAGALAVLVWPKGDGRRSSPPGLLIDTTGQQVTIGSRMAPVTLVHFWATWCPPCIQEVPSIRRLDEDMAGNHNFALLMIAVDDDHEKVKNFLGEFGHDSLFDQGWKLAHSYDTRKLPETHLVVRGEIVESYIGATDWDDPKIRRRIEEALAEASQAG